MTSKILLCASTVCVTKFLINKYLSTRTSVDKSESMTGKILMLVSSVYISYCLLNKLWSRTVEKSKIMSSLFTFEPQTNFKTILPIVHSENYDITLGGFQKFYVFDTEKWGKIRTKLTQILQKRLEDHTFVSPVRPISDQELTLVHTDLFMKNIYNSETIAQAAEIYFLKYLPSSWLTSTLLEPMKWQVAGSILAANMALDKKWAINLGGGFHHASAQYAGGFCFFADISLIIKYLWKERNENLKFMIIDLDAHQGNGYARDIGEFRKNPEKSQQLYILDVYNAYVFPQDNRAKSFIDKKVEIDSNYTNEKYLELVKKNVDEALEEFYPNLIIYNAGSDCLEGDPLGQLRVTPEGLKIRDQIIFEAARKRNISIVMLTSGGYQRSNADVIASSIANLFEKQIIF